MTPLPKEFSDFYSDGDVRSTVNITEVTYDFKPYPMSDDEYTLTFYFTGEKTYDIKGAGQSRSAHLGIKIYDTEGYVVDNESFYSPALSVGDKFRNEECKVYRIKAGEYNVEFLNTN